MDVSIQSETKDASSASEPLQEESHTNGSSSSSITTRKRTHKTTDESSVGADEASLSRKRPKRRAVTSSVRFGSYKDIENVDLSMLESFQFEQSLYTSSSRKPKNKTTKSDSTRTNTASMKKSSLIKPIVSKSSRALYRNTEKSENIVGDQATIFCSQREEARHLKGALVNKILPPIILERLNDRGQKVTNLPSLLRNPSGGVEIFNRKTGKIMRGEEAIPLENLAEALQNHSEYEPILRASTDTRGTYQKARSSETAFISSNIKPQSKIRESKAKGRTALIVSGPNRGLIGTISCRISGNWYVLENVFKNDSSDIDFLVVHGDDLKIIKTSSLEKKKNISHDKDKIIEGKDTSLKEREDAPNISDGKEAFVQEPILKTIDTLQLRIQALNDKKLKLQQNLLLVQQATPQGGHPTKNDTRSNIESQLKSLDEFINDASKQMEKYMIMKEMVVPSSSKK